MNLIEFENVYKQYHKRDLLFSKSDLFWAIQDLSFTVKQGEAIGLIGKNGAGKTTVMRLIAGISFPTHGRVRAQGRVVPVIAMSGCLFPFMNARENIEFLLSLHRVGRASRKKTLEAVTEFSGLMDFLDMPIKNFSSGMHSRLAFSVAVYLPGEALLIDETLAVGDKDFQQKCLEKIGTLKKEGKTILLTSHRMDEVKRISDRVFWLEKGRLKEEGDPEKVIAQYTAQSASTGKETYSSTPGPPTNTLP